MVCLTHPGPVLKEWTLGLTSQGNSEVDRQEWRKEALCKDLTPEEADSLFFVGRGQTKKRAQLFCSGCPVKRSCQDFAVLYNESGIWAGTTDDDRNAIRPMVHDMLQANAELMGVLETRDSRQWIPDPQPLQEPENFQIPSARTSDSRLAELMAMPLEQLLEAQ